MIAVIATATIFLAVPATAAEPVSIREACPQDRTPPSFFFDVDDSNTHGDAIDCIVWYEITAGTSDNTYSPTAAVRRDQMASFLVRMVSALGVAIPPGDARFEDTAGNVHEEAINLLASAGIAQGQGDGNYNPSGTVRRDQMATFLIRTHNYVVEEALTASGHHFTDTSGNPHEDNIDAAAEAGLASGVGEGRFAPAQRVRRDQMASFLARTLSSARPDVLGGRANPYPMGETVRFFDDWDVHVIESDPDATDRVLEENQFNDPPDDGHQYFMARVRATYRGGGSDRFGPSRLYTLGDSASTYTTFDNHCGVIPDSMDNNEQFQGGNVEGNVCWEIRSDDADNLRMFDGDADYRVREFMALLP